MNEENNCNVKFIVGYLLLYENIIYNNRNNSHYLSHFYEVLYLYNLTHYMKHFDACIPFCVNAIN